MPGRIEATVALVHRAMFRQPSEPRVVAGRVDAVITMFRSG